MPREKTKGDRIQVQLPLDVDASVRARALKRQTSPARVVEDIVTNTYRKVAPIGQVDIPLAPMTIETVASPITHTHRKALIGKAGLHVCGCGAIRGIDGEWR